MSVHGTRRNLVRELLARAIEHGLETDANTKALAIHVHGQFERLEREIRPCRIAMDIEGSITLTENARSLAWYLATVTIMKHGRQCHISRQFVRMPAESAYRTADAG